MIDPMPGTEMMHKIPALGSWNVAKPEHSSISIVDEYQTFQSCDSRR
jgi:hypothetical protein